MSTVEFGEGKVEVFLRRNLAENFAFRTKISTILSSKYSEKNRYSNRTGYRAYSD